MYITQIPIHYILNKNIRMCWLKLNWLEKSYVKVKMIIYREAFSRFIYKIRFIKHILTIDGYGIIQQHLTFKGFNDSKRLWDRSQFFKMLNCEKATVMLPKSWKKSFNNGIIIPVKMRRCDECKGERLCMTCNNQVNENKEFEANSNLIEDKLLTNLVVSFLILKNKMNYL